VGIIKTPGEWNSFAWDNLTLGKLMAIECALKEQTKRSAIGDEVYQIVRNALKKINKEFPHEK